MSDLLAKLVELTAVKSEDADGEDKIVMSRVDGVQFFPDHGTISIHQGDTEDLDIFLPISDSDVQVALHAAHPGSGLPPSFLGSVFIRADEAGHGEIQQQFTGAGALYNLKYTVS
ncbi:hypothetical protein ACWGKQ_31950 [Streptomyces sp. NPDC054770]